LAREIIKGNPSHCWVDVAIVLETLIIMHSKGWEKRMYLPPSDKISIDGHIGWKVLEITTELGLPAFVSLSEHLRFTNAVVF